MKRKSAKEILAESFYELTEHKDVDKITIKEITDNCGYSPATFYRQFRDKYDLIAWAYAASVARIMEKVGEDGFTWKKSLLEGAELFMRERDYLTNLLLHTSGQDAFIRYMADINEEALNRHIERTSGGKAPDETIRMYVRVYCLGTVSLTCEWLQGKYDLTTQELAEIYEKALPRPLYSHLYEDREASE